MSPVPPVSIVAFPKRGQGFRSAAPLQSVIYPYFKYDPEGEANVLSVPSISMSLKQFNTPRKYAAALNFMT